MSDVDLEDQEELKAYLDRLGTEYRFGCYYERNAVACNLLASYLEAIEVDFKKAFSVHVVNCDELNHPKSCDSVAGYLGEGRACHKNLKSALTYFEKACDMGFTRSCLKAGAIRLGPEILSDEEQLANVEPDWKSAAPLLAKSCNEGQETMGCEVFANGLIKGFISDENPMTTALTYLARSCDLGSPEACERVSQMYREGKGCQVDLELSRKYALVAKEFWRQQRSGGLEFGGNQS